MAAPSAAPKGIRAGIDGATDLWPGPGVDDEEELAALFGAAMPKEEIGALRFLKNFPHYDGRGVKICIFDTGVDPGAPGLQVTSDGKPKLIDVIDCTGSGDVDTSHVVKADAQGYVTGASGRRLRLNPAWTNPTGEWRVGCKHAYQLFPRPLVSRIKEERKKAWEEAQRRAMAAAAAALAKYDKKNPGAATSLAAAAPADASSNGGGGSGGNGGVLSPGGSKRQVRAELASRLELLKELGKSYEDHGPLLDCVVWHDGTHWRAALGTQELHTSASAATAGNTGNNAGNTPAGSNSTGSGEAAMQGSASAGEGDAGSTGSTAVQAAAAERPKGLLEDFVPMTDFDVDRQYATFSDLDSCNFGVHIYDAGAVLSIVVDAGAHGTHVAGITAAYFPDDPASNGIAPGAQIISCKIGDTRLGSMETGVGVARALIAARRHGAHLANMSYGEPTITPNQGRLIELINELVWKHGVFFVASAGNQGPALSTVGAPGGTTSAICSVGAYVSRRLAAAGHSVRDSVIPQAGLQYNWSSRGPTTDGAPGVSISAPGGAIAPVPQWTLQRRQLMNGTSMSSPNACGGIALLLSGLLATGQDASPARVRRAIENTAVPLGGDATDATLTYGRGLIQVDAAWEYLTRSAKMDVRGLRYDVFINPVEGPINGLVGVRGRLRGIYLREPQDTCRASVYSATVTPRLHEDAHNALKLDIEDRLSLEVISGASTTTGGTTGSTGSTTGGTIPPPSWVSCPGALLLHHSGRSFEVLVDPTRLAPGLHHAEVVGYDTQARWRGPLFRVPITALVPIRLPEPTYRPQAADSAAATFITTCASASATPSLSPSPLPSPAPSPVPWENAAAVTAATAPGGAGSVSSSAVVGGGGGEGDVVGGGGGAALGSGGGVVQRGVLPYGPSSERHEGGKGLMVPYQIGPTPYTLSLGPISFCPGAEFRVFVAVPPCATWAELILRAGVYDTPKTIMVRASQVRPEESYREYETRASVSLSGGGEYMTSFVVAGGSTMELTLAQFWSSHGSASLESVEVSFHGVGVTAPGGDHQGQLRPGAELALDGSALARKALVCAPLRAERIKPEAKLKRLLIPLRPSEATIEPLAASPRDELTDGRVVYRLVLQYKLSVTEAGKYKFEAPLLHGLIYESTLEGLLLQVFDAGKHLVATMEAHPEYVSLKKGDHTLRLVVRHDSQELLDKYKGLTLIAKRQLEGVTVPLYYSRKDATTGGTTAGEAVLRAGDIIPLWLGAVPDDKLPKDATQGRLLTGSLMLGQLKRAGSGAAPHKFSVTYLVPPPAPSSSSNGGNGDADGGVKQGPEEKLKEAVRDAQLKMLKDLSLSDEAQAALYRSTLTQLKADWPGRLPQLLQEHLRKLDGQEAAVRNIPEGLQAVIAAADEVVASIDQQALAAFYGVKAPAEETPELKKARKDMDERKAALVDALARKAHALMALADLSTTDSASSSSGTVAADTTAGAASTGEEGVASTPAADTPAATVAAAAVLDAAAGVVTDVTLDGQHQHQHHQQAQQALAGCLAELRKWVDTAADSAHMLLHAQAEAWEGRLASAIKVLDKLASDDKATPASRKECAELRVKLLGQLGWSHCQAHDTALLAVRFPKDLPAVL